MRLRVLNKPKKNRNVDGTVRGMTAQAINENVYIYHPPLGSTNTNEQKFVTFSDDERTLFLLPDAFQSVNEVIHDNKHPWEYHIQNRT